MKNLLKSALFILLLFVGNAVIAQNETTEKLAAQYFADGEFDKAVVLYEALYKNKPQRFYYNYYIDCLLKLEDYKTAEKFLKKEVRKNPDKVWIEVDLGFIYKKSGNLKKSESVYEDALSGLKPFKQAYVDLANAFDLRAENEYVLKTYRQGRKALDGTYGFYEEIADYFFLKGKYDAMVEEYMALLEYNPAQLGVVKSRFQDAINDKDGEAVAAAFRKGLLKQTKKYPEKSLYSDLLLWYYVQVKDFKMAILQAKSLDRRFNEDGDRVLSLARLAASNKEYSIAEEAYEYVLKKGKSGPYYQEALVGRLRMRYQQISSRAAIVPEEILELEKDYALTIDELGKGVPTIPLIIDYAHIMAFYGGKEVEAIAMLEQTLGYQTASLKVLANCKMELADIYLMSGEVWEATLLYSQVEKAFKNDILGHEAKFRNARLSYYIGEFNWARAQLDVLKAATTKLIANDAMHLSLLISDNINLVDSSTDELSLFSRADFLLFQKKEDEAWLTLDSIGMLGLYHPLSDEVFFKKAEIRIQQQRYQEADSLLSKLVSGFGYDILADDAIFLRAELHQYRFKNKQKAMELYEELLLNYPGSLYVVEARKRYRELRGDAL